ncbi:MAG: ribosome maturation factor RimP [Oscillospiraceae bacterium]|nr:ribosome maturation factor RimP [Oscillospiraceae bacterium]
MSRITDIVAGIAKPVAEAHGCELWDVEYVKEAGAWYLRVYIDREGGVSINDCEAVSRELDPLLDEADPISGSYTFEVSSAGAERQLKRPSDFERFIGHLVEVKLYRAVEGRKSYVGDLAAYDDGAVEITVPGGGNMRFEKSDVAGVRLRIA